MILLAYEIRRAVTDDVKALCNIIVKSWRSAYSEIIPKDEIALDFWIRIEDKTIREVYRRRGNCFNWNLR